MCAGLWISEMFQREKGKGTAPSQAERLQQPVRTMSEIAPGQEKYRHPREAEFHLLLVRRRYCVIEPDWIDRHQRGRRLLGSCLSFRVCCPTFGHIADPDQHALSQI